MASDSHSAPTGARWLPVIDGGVEAAFHVLVLLMPLVFYAESQFTIYEYAKLRLLYTAGAVAIGGWVLGWVLRRRVVVYRTPFDIPLAVWMAALGLATALSTNVPRSLWGRPETPADGFAPTAVSILLFYAFVGTMRTRAALARHAACVVTGGVLAAVYGTVQHYGLDPFVADTPTSMTFRAFAAMGNASPQGWYLGLLLPISAWMFYRLAGLGRAAAGLAWFVIVFGLLTTGTRSGYIGGCAGLLLLAAAMLAARRRGAPVTMGPALTLAGLAGIALLAFSVPASSVRPAAPPSAPVAAAPGMPATAPAPLATDPTTSSLRSDGTDRFPIWRDAVRIWLTRPLIGTGPDTFGDQHNLIRSSETFKDFLVMFGHAHNEYLHVLATSGVIGAAAFLWVLLAFLWFVRAQWLALRGSVVAGDVPRDRLWAVGASAAFLSIAVSQLFNPPFIPLTLLYYLLPAAACCWWQQAESPRVLTIELDVRPFAQVAAAAGICLAMMLGLHFNVRMWLAHVSYKQALDVLMQGRPMNARTLIDRAVEADPKDANYWWVKAQTYASLAVMLKREGGDFALMQTSERVALASSDRSVALDPQREDLWRQRSICLRDLLVVDPQLVTQAIDAIQQAITRFPRNGLNYLLKARLQNVARQPEAAIQSLQTAVELSPSIAVVHAELAVLYYGLRDVPNGSSQVDQFMATSPQAMQRNVLLALRDQAGRAGDERQKTRLEVYINSLDRVLAGTGR